VRHCWARCDTVMLSGRKGDGTEEEVFRSDLCSSPRGPPAPHRQSQGSPPPAPGALPAQGEAEGAAGEEGHSPALSAGSQACEHNNGGKVIG